MKKNDELNIPKLSFQQDQNNHEAMSAENAHGFGNQSVNMSNAETESEDYTYDTDMHADTLLEDDVAVDVDTQELFLFKWKKPAKFKSKMREYWQSLRKKHKKAKFNADLVNWQTPFFISMVGALVGCSIFALVFTMTNSVFNSRPPLEQQTQQTHEYIPASANDNDTSAIVSAVSPGIVTVLTGDRQHYLSGNGSGIVYRERDGKIYILTNAHVIADAAVIEVYRNDLGVGAVDRAEVLAADDINDIAVLVIERPQQLYPVAISFENSANLKVGQKVLAIGSPYVATLGTSFSGSVTEGIISGLNREIGTTKNVGLRNNKVIIQKYIQTDAAINGGNSGGALLDMNGNLIGMNSATITSADNIGFAIATNDIIEAMKEMKAPLPATVDYRSNTSERSVY